MAFTPGQNVFSCLPTLNTVAVNQTDTGERVYRDIISTPGQWNIGDTIKIKDATYVFFGYDNTKLTSKTYLANSSGTAIEVTVTGIGTTEVTVTLAGAGPNDDTLTIGYRCGIPSTYVELLQNRANDDLDIHKTIMVGGAKPYADIYNKPHKYCGTNASVAAIVQLDGLSIQTNPAT